MTTVTLAGPKNKFRLAEGVNLKGLWRLHAMMGGFFGALHLQKGGWLRILFIVNGDGYDQTLCATPKASTYRD